MRPETLEERIAWILKEWYGDTAGVHAKVADRIVAEIRETHRIEPQGTRIKPGDVRRGDRVRIEWHDGDVIEFVAVAGLPDGSPSKIYLLDRPDDGFVVPDRDGAVLRVTPKGFTDDARTVASREKGVWHVAGMEPTCSDAELREFYGDFTLLSDGSDQ